MAKKVKDLPVGKKSGAVKGGRPVSESRRK